MPASLQDLVAIAVALAAAAWLARTLRRRLFAPPCSPPQIMNVHPAPCQKPDISMAMKIAIREFWKVTLLNERRIGV